MEIGGSHVSIGLADLIGGRLVAGSRFRSAVNPDGTATEIIAAWTSAARQLGPGWENWGVAMPGPFDYRRGVGGFAGVGKFAALAGLDIGAALAAGIGGSVRIRFSNDADAFAVGEWLAIGDSRPDRLVGITLGTGVGTGFVDSGTAVTDGASVPPEGSAYRLSIDDRPLEETASSRAVLAAYNRACDADLDSVAALSELARQGDRVAREIFQGAWRAAAEALAPYISAFGARVVVVGGSIARSWDLVEPALLEGLTSWSRPLATTIELRRSNDPERSALLGAAFIASRAG